MSLEGLAWSLMALLNGNLKSELDCAVSLSYEKYKRG